VTPAEVAASMPCLTNQQAARVGTLLSLSDTESDR
jgi:hypothetical protein